MHIQPLIIAFGYKAQNGKDSAVKHLIETYGGHYDMRRYAFADALKIEVFDALLKWTDPAWEKTRGLFNYLTLPHPIFIDPAMEPKNEAEKIAWIDANKKYPDLARLLQWWGTEYRRNQDPFYWVKAMRDRIVRDKPQVALISDLRFQNEFAFVCAAKGYTVKVTRVGFQLNDGRSATHVSECQLDGYKFHFEIEVLDGELPELYKDVEYVFNEIVNLQNPVKVEENDVALGVH